MACAQGVIDDYELVFIDGSATPVEVSADVYGDITYSRGEREPVWPTNGRGLIMKDTPPWKGDQTPAFISFSGRVAGLGTIGGMIDSMSCVTTQLQDATYRIVLKVVRKGELEPTRYVLRWTGGATATITDDALKAEILSVLGITATGTSGTGPIVFAFPAGDSAELVGSDGGSGTVVVTASASGTALATGISFRDVVQQSGHFPQLVSTTGNDDCMGSHKTLHVELRPKSGTGPKYRLENAVQKGAPEFGMATAAGIQFSARWEAAELNIYETAA